MLTWKLQLLINLVGMPSFRGHILGLRKTTQYRIATEWCDSRTWDTSIVYNSFMIYLFCNTPYRFERL